MAEDKFDIKKEYAKLKAKYPKLPGFEKLNKEFELYAIKEPDYLIFSINKRLSEYNSFFCRLLESIILPNPANLMGAYESKSFTDDEKARITELHKQLMFIERESLIVHMKKDEKKAVKYTIKFMENWDKIKKEIAGMVEKMKQAWKTEESEHKNNYFG